MLAQDVPADNSSIIVEVIPIEGFNNVFSGRANGFYRPVKRFELNFFIRTKGV